MLPLAVDPGSDAISYSKYLDANAFANTTAPVVLYVLGIAPATVIVLPATRPWSVTVVTLAIYLLTPPSTLTSYCKSETWTWVPLSWK